MAGIPDSASRRPLELPTGRAVLAFALAGERRALAGASVLLAGHQAAEAAVPVLIGVVVDRAIEPSSGSAIVTWLIALAALFGVLSLSFRFGSRLSQQASLLAEHRLRLHLIGRLLTEPTSQARLLPGAVLSLATSDASRVAWLNASVAATVAALAAFAVAAAVLLATSLTLGLVVLIGLPPLLVALHLAAGPLERRSIEQQSAAAGAAGMATDLVSGLRVLKGLGAERAAIARYETASRESLHATLRAAAAESLYSGTAIGFVGVFLAAVALVGGRLATEGEISVGQLVAALGLAQFLIGPINRLGSSVGTFAQARASATRIATALEPDTRRHSTVHALLQDGALEVRLGDRAFAVRPGELVGVAAATADAAAIVEALATVGSADLLVVPHDADLFSGTLIDNVRSAAAVDRPVQAAMAAAAADEVAASLPHGEHSEIGERGRLLSGGQQQRVALARALAVDAPVLVLHDPTTAVDPVTEAQIAAGIHELRAGLATLLVTTSPALLARCDRVIHIGEAGASEGSHGLLAGNPGYRELVFG